MHGLSPNQLVAFNLREARKLREWTQVEAAERLEPHLGTRWSEAVFSSAERSVDGKRVREFTADDLVALSNAFELPIVFFLLPPRVTTKVPFGESEEGFAKAARFANGLIEQGYTGDVTAPEGADTRVEDVVTPAGITSAADLLERLLVLDDVTLQRIQTLAESLPEEERRELFARVAHRDSQLGASRLGDLKKHTQRLRELADLLEAVQPVASDPKVKS